MPPSSQTSSPHQADACDTNAMISSWWEIQPVSAASATTAGATAIYNRCIRVYGWSDDLARRVLAGYKKFLELKRDLCDWNHQILSPSVLVDQMWHQHILDVRNYVQDCELLCGQLVSHNPDGMLDREAKARRVATTKHILRGQLGEVDEEVWDFGDQLTEEEEGGEDTSANRGVRRSRESSDSEDARSSDDEDDKIFQPFVQRQRVLPVSPESITILVQDERGGKTQFKIRQTTKMGKVFQAFYKRKGIDRDTFRFQLDGDPISDDHTAKMLELEDGDQIDALLRQYGC